MKGFTTLESRTRALGVKTVVLVFWLLVWQGFYLWVGREVLLPSPFQAGVRLLELGHTALFWQAVWFTCLRVIWGFLAAVALGTLLAVATWRSRLVHALFRPLLGVVKATPVASFIILALVWIKPVERLPAFIAFLMVLPGIWANVVAALGQTDKGLLEMARVFRFSGWKKLRYIYLPQVMPGFLAACSTGLGFAWKSAIAAEVIARPNHAMGKNIYLSKIYLETADLFAWTLGVIIISVLLEKATVALLNRLNRLLARA